MVKLRQSWLVWSLLVCLVLVNGLLTVPAVAHAEHHAKHQAGTHSTGLCAWQCAAGQSIETTTVVFVSTLQFVHLADDPQLNQISIAAPFFLFVRGPPSLLG